MTATRALPVPVACDGTQASDLHPGRRWNRLGKRPSRRNPTGWFCWAGPSAVFAALTAILAEIGIQGADSDLATLLRTAVIIVVPSAFVRFAGRWGSPFPRPTAHASGMDRHRDGRRRRARPGDRALT